MIQCDLSATCGGTPPPRALIPVLVRTLERGVGPPALLAWVRANGGSAVGDPSGTRQGDERVGELALRLANRLRGNRVVPAGAEQGGQPARPQRPRVEGVDAGETVVR